MYSSCSFYRNLYMYWPPVTIIWLSLLWLSLVENDPNILLVASPVWSETQQALLQASVWYGCVIRGDLNNIKIGSFSNVQDRTVIHAARCAKIPRFITVSKASHKMQASSSHEGLLKFNLSLQMDFHSGTIWSLFAADWVTDVFSYPQDLTNRSECCHVDRALCYNWPRMHAAVHHSWTWEHHWGQMCSDGGLTGGTPLCSCPWHCRLTWAADSLWTALGRQSCALRQGSYCWWGTFKLTQHKICVSKLCFICHAALQAVVFCIALGVVCYYT